MSITLEHQSPTDAKLKIQIPASIVRERVNEYFGALAQRVNIPGFRPGKAPAHVVKQHYGQEAMADLSERLIAEYVGRAVDEKKLDLVMPPVLLATDLPHEQKDFNFEVEIALRPKIEKVNFEGLSIEVESPTSPSPEDVENEIKMMRESEATFTDVKEIRAVTDKDCAVINFKGTIDGVEDPRMAAENHTAVLGQGRFLPEFEKAIIGLKVGESKDFPLTFPADYQEKSLQGKTAQFSVTVNGLKEKAMPELNDEFAKSVDPEVKSLDELRSKIHKQLEESNKLGLEKRKRDAIGDILVTKNPVEVSRKQVENFAQKLAEQTHHMMHQMGVQHEETEEHARSLMESSLKKAERDVRLSYILETIAREQKFEVTNEDFKKRFEDTARRTGYSVTQVQQYYAAKDEEDKLSRMDRLKIDILDEKSLDYVLSRATIKLKDTPK